MVFLLRVFSPGLSLSFFVLWIHLGTEVITTLELK